MTLNIIKAILILLASSSFFSCKEQVKIEKQIAANPLNIGKVVSKIDNQIWAVFQDKKGNYWFGSNGKGVYRFDGKVLTLFTRNDGLIDNTIRGIQEDKKGNIYIETPNGVSKFDGNQFVTLEIIKSPDNQWKLTKNDLWFNCNGNASQVYRFDGNALYELKLPRKNIKDVLGIDEYQTRYNPYTVFGIDKDKDGNVWFGTVVAGAFRFDGKSFLWVGEKELSRLPDGREPGVRSILEDLNGDIWLSNFINKYTIEPNSANGYKKQQAVEISEEIEKDDILYFNSGLADKNGNLWMTTYGGGVWKYDGKTLSRTEISNGNEEVLLISIYQDQNETIWLGTNNDGVYKQNGNGFEKFEPK